MKHRPRRNRRSRERGAAFAETVVVMSVQVMFMGLILWVGGRSGTYGTKLDMQQRTRSDVAYYTSHACENAGGGIGRPGGGGTVPERERNPAARTANASGLPDSAAVSSQYNSGEGTLSTTVTQQMAYDRNASQGGKIDYAKQTLSSNVSAASYGTCNEKKYNSQLTAWFQFGVSMFQTRGGFADLFRGN